MKNSHLTAKRERLSYSPAKEQTKFPQQQQPKKQLSPKSLNSANGGDCEPSAAKAEGIMAVSIKQDMEASKGLFLFS